MSRNDPTLISVPFGSESETVSSPRYSWDSMDRGRERFVILQYTLRGCGIFRRGGVEHEVPAGRAFIAIVPEKARYFYPAHAREPWTFCWLNFYGSLGVGLLRRLRYRFGPVLSLPPKSDAALKLRRLAGEIAKRRFATPFEASEAAYAFCMSCWLQMEESAPPLSMAGVFRYCQENFRDPVSVKELAARSGMSREHFTRVFSAELGISPAALLRRNRLKAAAELLRGSALPLREVALRAGFYSARHLMKAFQSEFGKTPREYRAYAGLEGPVRKKNSMEIEPV